MEPNKKLTKTLGVNCAGLTLIELLIASTLGLFIVAIVFSLFLSSRLSLNETERLSVINENARYAASVLINELRLVDFFGRTTSASISLDSDLVSIGGGDCSGNAAGYDLSNSLWVVLAENSTVANCVNNAATNSDVIFIKRAGSDVVNFADMESGKNYLMTNHMTGVLFNESDTDSPPTSNVGGDVPGGEIQEYIAAAYYVRNVDGESPTLYRKRLTGSAWEDPGQEVAVGVERIHLQFGVDTNNDATADFFVASGDVPTWDNVVSARLYLLVRSENADEDFTDTKTYQLGEAAFGGVTYEPNDNYHRLLVETSISFRNRRLIFSGGL